MCWLEVRWRDSPDIDVHHQHGRQPEGDTRGHEAVHGAGLGDTSVTTQQRPPHLELTFPGLLLPLPAGREDGDCPHQGARAPGQEDDDGGPPCGGPRLVQQRLLHQSCYYSSLTSNPPISSSNLYIIIIISISPVLDNGVVSVQTDSTQVEDGGGAAGHVQGGVEVAEENS